MSDVATAEAPTIDGRTARRDRNRAAVLDAVIELFTEGEFDPNPDVVAERVGVSARSIYRYFEDHDALVRAAIEHRQEQVRPLFLIRDIGVGDLEDRIERFVDARMRLYEEIAPSARVARARAVVVPIMREQVEQARHRLTEQMEKHFAPELRALDARRRRSVSGAIDALSELEALDHLRVHRGFSARETRTTLVDALHALLGGRHG
jgi:AcrR family transcriptional regulator